MDRYLDFLYLIASVFAPMAAVLLVHGFLTRRGGDASRGATVWNLVAWALGFAAYHVCLGAESPLYAAFPHAFGFLGGWASPCGATLPAMAVAAVVAVSSELTRR